MNRERDEKEVGSVIGLPQRALASLSGPIAICVLTFFALGLVGERARGEDKQAVADWPVWLAETQAGAPQPTTNPNLVQSTGARSQPPEPPSTRWSRATLDLIVKYRLNPVRASRVLALVHAAMNDALVRATRQSRDQHLPWVAVHRAASLALADLFPEELPERFEALGLGAAATVAGPDSDKAFAMWIIGGEVARDTAARARADGSDRVWAVDRRPQPAPGRWIPTPPINSFNPLEPLAGEWRPWVLADGGSVEPPEPVAYDSKHFWEEVDEVKATAASLTPAQKTIAQTWNLDRGTVTPAGVWNLKATKLAEEQKLDEPQTLRMLAALNVAMADAFITCWHAKYKWWTIRPISVIRERYEPEFLSTLLTPPFPSYVSGHASASGAAEATLARFFPAKADWLHAQAEEAALSRLYGGIHYRSDNEEGLKLGREVGRRVIQRVFGQASAGP